MDGGRALSDIVRGWLADSAAGGRRQTTFRSPGDSDSSPARHAAKQSRRSTLPPTPPEMDGGPSQQQAMPPTNKLYGALGCAGGGARRMALLVRTANPPALRAPCASGCCNRAMPPPHSLRAQ